MTPSKFRSFIRVSVHHQHKCSITKIYSSLHDITLFDMVLMLHQQHALKHSTFYISTINVVFVLIAKAMMTLRNFTGWFSQAISCLT